MSLKVELLRSSFKTVLPKKGELMETFYGTLFERNPAVKPLFDGVGMESLHEKLFKSLEFVVDYADKPEKLKPILQDLGRKHIGYGAKAEHYPAVGEALLHALKTVAGDAWSPEQDAAWQEAFGLVAGVMMTGATQK